MKKIVLCAFLGSAPLFAQVDLFTGKPINPAPADPPAPPAAAQTAPAPLPPGDPSLVILLGKDMLPPFAYPQHVRGYKGSIDWKQVPDLGYNKEEIQAVTILQRQPAAMEKSLRTFAPSLWHFKAETWETVYSGSIPYLEDLMFLEDGLRARLTTRVESVRVQSAEGYRMDAETGAPGFYQAVNSPINGAVSQIIVVRAGDNREINRLQAAFEQASDTPPIVRPPNTPGLDLSTPPLKAASEALPAGVSIFEKGQL